MKTTDKPLTFKFFNYKWSRVPTWARATDHIYQTWYLNRYGYKNLQGFKKFLADKMSVCEAGCGVARDSKMFAEANPQAKILAVDQSKQALREAKRSLAKFPNCKTLRADITNFVVPQKFNFISCDQVMHHTPDPGKTLKHLFSKLKPGGVLNFCVCRKKNPYRDLVDDLIMNRARDMKPKDLWEFSRIVTEFGKALYKLNIKNVTFQGRKYENLQRFIHNQVFRCWYNPSIPFELSVSSNYDWFSSNPRFNAAEVRKDMLGKISGFKVLRFFEDDAVISVSLKKLK
ncbi:MAG: class I SAM-dependent methyltransferase [bacterium]|nr:class I SAM-dependent methyltransferase [bacterium]